MPGTSHRQFMSLLECVGGRTWVAVCVTILCVGMVAGYTCIGVEWQRGRKSLLLGPANTALVRMRNIFLFCGLCGYGFLPMKFILPPRLLPYVWLAWGVSMLFLNYFTWAYWLNRKHFCVVYENVAAHPHAEQSIVGITTALDQNDVQAAKEIVVAYWRVVDEVRRELDLPPSSVLRD
jgi:hypothetical protein